MEAVLKRSKIVLDLCVAIELLQNPDGSLTGEVMCSLPDFAQTDGPLAASFGGDDLDVAVGQLTMFLKHWVTANPNAAVALKPGSYEEYTKDPKYAECVWTNLHFEYGEG